MLNYFKFNIGNKILCANTKERRRYLENSSFSKYK